jgi:hypothetical protein
MTNAFGPLAAGLGVAAALAVAGCGRNEAGQTPPAAPESGGATAGVEKVKPAPGTGNVQGYVLYNGKPAAGIAVRLCEKFSQYGDGCGGKIHEARTDQAGDYVLANLEPKTYEALTVQVFDTDIYVFAMSRTGVGAATHEVAANKTLFLPPTHLFKADLKTLNPKAGSRVSAKGLELKWQSYPDAAFYMFSLYPAEASVPSPYLGHRVDGASFVVDRPLPKGEYSWKIEAFNDDGRKLSENPREVKFTVTGGG